MVLAPPDRKEFVEKTYESLDSLLIAVSPGYVRAMGEELARRFEVPSSSHFVWDAEDGERYEEGDTGGLESSGADERIGREGSFVRRLDEFEEEQGQDDGI